MRLMTTTTLLIGLLGASCTVEKASYSEDWAAEEIAGPEGKAIQGCRRKQEEVDFQDRIFRKLVQVEGRRNGRELGTGLGLTFCRLATEAQAGTIRVESVSGNGSAFHVSDRASRV